MKFKEFYRSFSDFVDSIPREEIGEDAMVAGGSVVSPRTIIPPGMVAMGVPARPVRPVTDEERAFNAWSVGHYVDLARRYREG